MDSSSSVKTRLVSITFAFAALIIFGLLWAFVFGPKNPTGLGWYLFSYAMGLTMIVLPCTLPLAFVVVPLSMGKGPVKGLGIALSFGLGVSLMLSMYGLLAAFVGGTAIGALGANLEVVKNWVYFIAGIFAYTFALGEIGLVKFRMPSYTGAAPAFIQTQQDYVKAFFLGLFLGNIGVGCPHPATPLILTEIATAGTGTAGHLFYGWSLFLVHAIGRVIPLLFLALLGVLGVNALSWLVARKDKLERATGWTMVFVGAFILTLGLFTHAWWVNSGQHTLFEEITQEERFLGALSSHIGVGATHSHGPEVGVGLFSLPLVLGNWFLVLLWILPLWWYFKKKEKETMGASEEEKKIEQRARPLRFWLFLLFSIVIALSVIMILPNRFLRQAAVKAMVHTDPVGTPAHMHPPGMQMTPEAMNAMMSQNSVNSTSTTHSHTSLFHEESTVTSGPVVNFSTSPSALAVGVPGVLRFFANTLPGSLPIKNLEIEHEKLIHVIGLRDDMNGFFHIHPQLTSEGTFSINYTFPKPGTYKIWSEIKENAIIHAFGHRTFFVSGNGVTSEKIVTFHRSQEVGGYNARFYAPEKISKGSPVRLSFDVDGQNAQAASLDMYLGVPMHLAIIKDDFSEFIHTHPVDKNTPLPAQNSGDGHTDHTHSLIPKAHAHEGTTPSPQAIYFDATFPSEGLYKVFAQFHPTGSVLKADEALVAEFWVKVDVNKAVNPQSQRSGLILVSLVLIVFLSLAVKKFITVT